MKKRITRLIATLTLSTIAATGYTLTDGPVATTQQDTGWGAPDTTHTPLTEEVDTGAVIDTVLGDSGWG